MELSPVNMNVWECTDQQLCVIANADRQAALARTRNPDFAQAYQDALDNLMTSRPLEIISGFRGSLKYDYVEWTLEGKTEDMERIRIVRKTGDVVHQKKVVANIVSTASLTVWQRCDFSVGLPDEARDWCGTCAKQTEF